MEGNDSDIRIIGDVMEPQTITKSWHYWLTSQWVFSEKNGKSMCNQLQNNDITDYWLTSERIPIK